MRLGAIFANERVIYNVWRERVRMASSGFE